MAGRNYKRLPSLQVGNHNQKYFSVPSEPFRKCRVLHFACLMPKPPIEAMSPTECCYKNIQQGKFGKRRLHQNIRCHGKVHHKQVHPMFFFPHNYYKPW